MLANKLADFFILFHYLYVCAYGIYRHIEVIKYQYYVTGSVITDIELYIRRCERNGGRDERKESRGEEDCSVRAIQYNVFIVLSR